MALMTPADLTKTINNSIDSISVSIDRRWLSRIPLKISALISSIVIALLYGQFFDTTTIKPEFHALTNPSFFESRYFWVMPLTTPVILVAESLLSFMIESPAIKGLILFVFGLFAIPTLFAYFSPEVYAPLATLSVIFTLLMHILALYSTRRFKISTRFLLFMVLEFALIIFFKSVLADQVLSYTFWLSQPYRYIFIFTILAAEEHIRKKGTFYDLQTLSYIFTPTNFITPLPISRSEWTPNPAKKSALKARALVFLTIGLFMLYSCIAVFKVSLKHFDHYHNTIFFWPVSGAFEYLYFFTFSYTNITVPIAICWWFGYDLPDAYNVPLLATTPQDRWRRWNTYFYKWYFDFVFFPTFKKYKSLFISVMASFGVTLFVHLGQHNYDLYELTAGDGLSRQFNRKAAFFCVHGLLVYLGIKLDRFLPRDTQLSGWLSVIVLFIIMSFLHGVYTL